MNGSQCITCHHKKVITGHENDLKNRYDLKITDDLKNEDNLKNEDDLKNEVNLKNASHKMAIVGEPCNVNAHAKIPALFITILCPCCVYTCTVQLYILTVTV